MLHLSDVIAVLDEEEQQLKSRIVGLKEQSEFNELVGKLKLLKTLESKLTTRFQSG